MNPPYAPAPALDAPVLLKGALAVLNHGFGDSQGNVDAPDGWHGLAEVSPVLLDNLGEHGLAAVARALLPSPALVWVTADSDGRHRILATAWVDSPEERDMIGAWEAYDAGE